MKLTQVEQRDLLSAGRESTVRKRVGRQSAENKARVLINPQTCKSATVGWWRRITLDFCDRLPLVALALVVGFAVPCLAQGTRPNPASFTNHVLELNGTNGYVELPPDIFSNLTAATVEGWVKWRSFRGYSRFFDFGVASNAMAVINHLTQPDLRFNLYPAGDALRARLCGWGIY